MIRLGLIGCGGMGNYHAQPLKDVSGLELTICCDIIPEKAQDFAQRFETDCCTDYREVLDKVDAVWVCTEPFNRVNIVTDAAAAGKQIFSEKPLALNLDDADRMIAAVREAGVMYMLGYCLRYWQPYKIMHDTFATGELGDLVTCWTRRYMPADVRDMWYGKQELSGGVALDFGSHDMDWLTWIGGKVESVFGRTLRVREGAESDEHSQCTLTFAAGGVGHSDVSWLDTINESSLGIVGTAGSMMVGRDGIVKQKMIDGEELTVDVDSAMSVDRLGHLGQRDDTGKIQDVDIKDETMYEHFVRCIEEGVTPVTDVHIGRDVLEIVLAVRQSAETNQVVTLDT
ncbi:MAG: Gfo/Idh/MocA family protein [Planctomycetota bacterium]|jgi:predicted dehydrogenase